MDPNASAPSQQTQNTPAVGRAQAPEVRTPQPVIPPSAVIPTPQTIAVGKETQPAVMSTGESSPEQTEQIAKAVSTPEAPRAEVREAGETLPPPERSEQQAEVEKFVEVAPDSEKPEIPKEVQQVGVTHSGPGLIIEDNDFNIKALPVTYYQAASAEKATDIKESRHWLMAQIMYIWRKINPLYGKEKRSKKGEIPSSIPTKGFAPRNSEH